MGGWKQIGSVKICGAPRCPGYKEVVEKPPLMKSVVLCAKDPEGNHFEKMIELRNDIHSYWQKR